MYIFACSSTFAVVDARGTESCWVQLFRDRRSDRLIGRSLRDSDYGRIVMPPVGNSFYGEPGQIVLVTLVGSERKFGIALVSKLTLIFTASGNRHYLDCKTLYDGADITELDKVLERPSKSRTTCDQERLRAFRKQMLEKVRLADRGLQAQIVLFVSQFSDSAVTC